MKKRLTGELIELRNMDRRFEQVDKRFERVVSQIDRFMWWSLGLTVSATVFITSYLKSG
jgi:ABC-type uncharacterized transport system fused permease/ATPase subunit